MRRAAFTALSGLSTWLSFPKLSFKSLRVKGAYILLRLAKLVLSSFVRVPTGEEELKDFRNSAILS